MISEFWDDIGAAGWDNQVGQNGDRFQQTSIKPFVISCYLDHQLKNESIELIYPLIQREVINAPSKNLVETDFWKNLILKLYDYELNLSDTAVIDLGCGEGYICRFLSEFGANCIGIDGSSSLIKLAEAKNTNKTSNIKYLINDFNDNNINLCSVLENEDILDSKKSIFITCMNVFDHIKNVEHFVSEISKFSKKANGKAIISLSTLNPNFFVQVGPIQNSENFRKEDEETKTFKFEWSDENVNFYSRDWITYESLFAKYKMTSKFNSFVDLDMYGSFDTTEPFNFNTPEELPINEQWPNASGPFILWKIESETHQEPIIIDDLNVIIDNSSHTKDLSRFEKDFLIKNFNKMRYYEFPANHTVASSGEKCPGVSVITKGIFIVSSGKSDSQILNIGNAYGDLESGSEFYAGRYLYDIRTGSKGGNCLVIPSKVLDNLFDTKGIEKGYSLGDKLFLNMRKMFNIYAPFYHRSHEIYPARHKKKLVKDIFELFGKNISARNLEHFVGACVTLLNVDESRFKNIHGFPNPSLLIDTSGIKNWMLGKDSKDMAVSRPTYFSAEIALLHDLGVIDSFNISEILKSTNEEAKELIYQSYERIIENAKKQIGKRINKELNHGDLSQIINSQHFKTIGLRQPDARILTKNKKTEFIPQKIIEQLIIESERSLRNFSDDQAAIESSVQDFYYNISFLQWSIFRADSKSFIVVRDYPFLRRIIGGGDDWLYEIALRGELYNSVLKERHRIKGQTVKDPRFRIQRLQNYLSYLESYVIGHWSMGLDVDYCGSHRLNSSSPASWRHGVSR